MSNPFEAIEAYVKLEDEPIYEDFQSIVKDVLDAREANRPFTSSQLPDGFESESLEDADFGFEALKDYENGSITVNYEERSSISFNKKDSSTVKVHVDPFNYSFTENWDHRR